MYYPPYYNTHTLKGPLPPPPYSQPQDVPPTILQHSYTKGIPQPPPLPPTTVCTTHHLTTHTLKGPPTPTSYPQPQDVPSTILQHSYTKGTPHPPTPKHRMYHPPSYNTHTLKGPPNPHPLPPTTGCTIHHLTTLIY